MSDLTNVLRLEPRFSKRFALILTLIHTGALLLLLPLALPIVVKFGIGLLVLASSRHVSHKHLLLIKHPLYGCLLYYDYSMRCLRLKLQSGEERLIASGSYSHPQCIVLRVTGESEALIIFPDALDKHSFRQLRVLMRADGGLINLQFSILSSKKNLIVE
jgi:hypothetical protein